MADKLPTGPIAPARQKRGIWSDLASSVQQPAGDRRMASVDAPEQESDVTPDAPTASPRKATKKPSKKSAGSKAKGWDRTGQIAVVLGDERHARLKDVWKRNATSYDAIADLVREAIDEKLDQLER